MFIDMAMVKAAVELLVMTVDMVTTTIILTFIGIEKEENEIKAWGIIKVKLNVITNKFGHFSSECWHNQANQIQGKENYAKEDDSVLQLAQNGDNATSKKLRHLYSNTSKHMWGHKEIFTKLNKKVNGEVSFDDASMVQVSGVGKILIKLKNGSQQYISNVYYVTKMKTNILSLRQLMEKGYDIQIENENM